MADPDLPDAPVVAWSESRCPWWSYGLLPLIHGVVERHRDLSMSSNGIVVDKRFLSWDEVTDIVEAKGPDLASIRLRGGDSVRLDRWHLPFAGARQAKAERLAILQRALAACRPASQG